MASVQAFFGTGASVWCLTSTGDGQEIFVGGARGEIKILRSSPLAVAHSYCVLESSAAATAAVATPRSARTPDVAAAGGGGGTMRRRSSSASAAGRAGAKLRAGAGAGAAVGVGPKNVWEGPRDRPEVKRQTPTGTRASADVRGLALLQVMNYLL